MRIDFLSFQAGKQTMADFLAPYTLSDLRETTHQHIDLMVALTRTLTDAQTTFVPHDPEAPEGIGWTFGHVILHVTASGEESATFGSLLARGVNMPFEPRLRYEPEWETVTTVNQLLQRLEESRRVRVAYLSAWPDTPFMDTTRIVPPYLSETYGTPINAMVATSMGLRHEAGHFAQLREAVRQAKDALKD
jgi:hypothetical protein